MATGNKKRKQSQRPQGYQENHAFRLFIAVEIPPESVERLVAWQHEYLAADPALRLTPPGQLHITLAFIGPAGDRERELAVAQLDGLVVRSAFTAAMPGMIGLPRRKPHVIAARVEEPSGTLQSIHDELASGLVAKGIYKREKRPYLPHVTIARTHGRAGIDLAEITPEPVQFTAVRLTLYNSILKSSGALHKALKTVQLN